MDYVEGAALSDLLAPGERPGGDEDAVPARVVARVLLDACAGLHAAHELKDDDGAPLGLVHRDVTPHNILVGTDGIARIADFAVAKCDGGETAGPRTGALQGQVRDRAPEEGPGAELAATRQ